MLVVLIQPRTPSAALDFRYRGEHLGLSSLVAVLKRAGHRAIQLDDALDKRDLASTLLILEALRPDLVGVTVPAQTAAGTAIRYIEAIRRALPQTPICTGGIFATVAYEEFMRRCPSIDYLLRGEGEETLPELLDALGDSSDVILGVHSKVTLDPENRYIVHFPEENKIISVNSNYGGNVLQGKKCFSLRIASVLGRREGWLAEHMLILGIQNPKGEVRYVTGAFPSACGKTNLAMLIPPEGYRKNGWKCWTVGDDIAWLRVGPDGRLWAVNPENGFFGVAPGTSQKSNPNALASTSKNTIFTNVVLNEDDMTVWWEGMTKQPPKGHLRNWKGEVWDGSDGTRGAHPNSRFTAPAENCPCISEEFFKGTGVPISAIIFGGRRAKTAPLVYQSRDWAHGVFVGATMASETTAAATGAVGVVRRDPMAMRPFCGYNMADYWQHWLDMGEKLPNAPKIFNVNWFRTDDNGRFLWPGFGDNLRVLEWILKRCFDEVGADETVIGYEPKPEDINLDGSGVTVETLRALLTLDAESWRENCAGIREYFEQFGDKLPHELREELEALEKAFAE